MASFAVACKEKEQSKLQTPTSLPSVLVVQDFIYTEVNRSIWFLFVFDDLWLQWLGDNCQEYLNRSRLLSKPELIPWCSLKLLPSVPSRCVRSTQGQSSCGEKFFILSSDSPHLNLVSTLESKYLIHCEIRKLLRQL